jgi:hypothetical protein
VFYESTTVVSCMLCSKPCEESRHFGDGPEAEEGAVFQARACGWSLLPHRGRLAVICRACAPRAMVVREHVAV